MKSFISYLFMLVSFIGYASPMDSIRGIVMNKKEQAIPYANVLLLLAKDSSFINGVISDYDGSFCVPIESSNHYLLKISHINYNDLYQYMDLSAEQINLERKFVLSEEDNALDEVVVSAQRKQIRIEGNKMILNVSNSALSTTGTVEDLLKYVPGVVYSMDQYVVLGKGAPTIYIDNKEVRNEAELQQLSSDNVQSIELISNPGSSISADKRAILVIKTKGKRGNGLSFSLYDRFMYKYLPSNRSTFDFTYGNNKMNFLFSSMYDYRQFKNSYLLDETHYGENIWRQDTYSKYRDKVNNVNIISEFGYNFNKNNNFSLQYQYKDVDTGVHSDDLGTVFLYKEDSLSDCLTSDFHKYIHVKQHIVNLFYKGSFSPRVSFSANVDYLLNHSKEDQQVYENYNGVDSETSTFSKNTNNLFASKISLDYKLNKKDRLSLGWDMDAIKRTGDFYNPEKVLTDNIFENQELRTAFFVSYNFHLAKLSGEIGLRYEYMKAKMLEYEKMVVDQDYSDIFPALNLNWKVKNLMMRLAFSNRITRPSFNQLNNNVQYNHMFHQEKGNPYLNPQKIYDLSYGLGYRFLDFSVNYQYITDYISQQVDVSQKSEAGTVVMPVNYDHYQQLGAMLSLYYTVSKWSPRLSVGVYKPFFKLPYRDTYYQYNKAFANIAFMNTITLPNDFFIDVDFVFTTAGSHEILNAGSVGSFDVDIKKMLWNKSLILILKGGDLFQWSDYDSNTGMNIIKLNRSVKEFSRYVMLSIRWNFNNYKKKFKKSSVIENNVNRF